MWQNLLGASKPIIWIVAIPLLLSCADGTNILGELSNKTTDDALVQQARQDINDGNYAGAVSSCEQITSSGLNNRTAAYVCASAYAGRCGLDFVTLLDDISTYAGAPNLMEYLMTLSTGATATTVTDCVAAVSLLQNIGTAAERTNDENLLMVLVNIQTLGELGSLNADTDDDDAIDGGYNTCTEMDATEAQYIAEAFWELEASGASTGISDLSDISTVIETACTAIDGFDNNHDFCDAADPDSFTADHLLGAEGLFREDTATFGMGDCAGIVTACICP